VLKPTAHVNNVPPAVSNANLMQIIALVDSAAMVTPCKKVSALKS
jgi:hypothetical protein